MKFPLKYHYCALAILSTVISACMYDPIIQQGKSISDQDLKQLRLQMSQEEVTSILGKPLIKNNQGKQQWRYISAKSQQKQQTLETITLKFKQNKLIKIEKKRVKQAL